MQMPGFSNNTASDPPRNCSSSFLITRLILSPLSAPRPFYSSSSSPSLPARHSTRLCHRSVLLLEPLAESLGALEELVDAAHDAALLLGEKRLGSEVGDAVGEAALDEVGVHLRSESETLAVVQRRRWYAFLLARTFMKSFICLRSMRPCSSRCSAAFSLLRGFSQPLSFESLCLFETIVAPAMYPGRFDGSAPLLVVLTSPFRSCWMCENWWIWRVGKVAI